MFASQDLNSGAGACIEIVQFNPKVMVYEVYGYRQHAHIGYFDPDANCCTRSRDPAVVDHLSRRSDVSASLMARPMVNRLMRVTVKEPFVRSNRPRGSTPQTYCLVSRS